MSHKKRVAISIGDLNGIGIQLALENHPILSQEIEPLYCIDKSMLTQAAKKLRLSIPNDFRITENIAQSFTIKAGEVSKVSGAYAYASFLLAAELARESRVDAICTLPIQKKAWELAGVHYKGHTDALRDLFTADAIMMLGCPEMYVALYTEHIPLREVPERINEKELTQFLINFYKTAKPTSTVGVLGLNPHAGDDGVLGSEEKTIEKAIQNATKILYKENSSLITLHSSLFTKPMVPDIAFTPNIRKRYTHYVAMYHDQGLAPLKALYFDEGINVSLNLPIIRTSVDHGTAFDIAYKGSTLNSKSYINAIEYIVNS